LAAKRGLDQNLRDDTSARQLTSIRRVRIALDIATALNFMHSGRCDGVAYHRDIKSGNIALTSDWRAKLIDCGLAKYAPRNQNLAATQTCFQTRIGGQQFGSY
jgi:serine/threonine protein kinase